MPLSRRADEFNDLLSILEFEDGRDEMHDINKIHYKTHQQETKRKTSRKLLSVLPNDPFNDTVTFGDSQNHSSINIHSDSMQTDANPEVTNSLLN